MLHRFSDMDLFDPELYSATVEGARVPIDGRLDVDTYNTLTYGNNYRNV